MDDKNIVDNKRIAKNTLLLYFRMILILMVGLYSSRVILQTLGVQDYGIYTVVAGFLSMFSILTGALSSAIMRYITVEIAKNDIDRLKKVFATSLSVQLLMGVLVLILIETVGIWFLTHKMSIPYGREGAALFCLHCASFSVFMSLLYVPFNSMIIAFERMSAFAYVSTIEALLKLSICYLLFITPFDRLKTYALMLCCVSVLIQLIYWGYCKRQFEGCVLRFQIDRGLFKEIWAFAGWNLLGNGAGILNTQGINMIMNVFFGVVINAARGIADQVNNVVQLFVNNFMMALNPQITKSYAIGDKMSAFALVCRGARFSFYIMFIIALPIILESEQILKIWLKTPPEMAYVFLNWTIIASVTLVLGNTLITLQMAHGDVKQYQILMTSFGLLPFPASWIAFSLGASATISYAIYFCVYWILIFVRYMLVRRKTGLPANQYLKGVVLNCHITAILSTIIPLCVRYVMPVSYLRLAVVCILSIICTMFTIYSFSIQESERKMVNKYILKYFKRDNYANKL